MDMKVQDQALRRARPKPGRPFATPQTITLPALLPGGTDTAFRHAIHALLICSARLSLCRAAFGREVGLTGAQYLILMATARLQRASGVTIRALSDDMHVAAPHVTTEVRKLVEAGLLSKRPAVGDGRAVEVTLAERGEATLIQLAPLLREINDILFAGVTRSEFQLLQGFLDKFVINTERALHRLAEPDLARRRAARAPTKGGANAEKR